MVTFSDTNLLNVLELNSKRHKISFLNARGLKRSHFDIFDMLFPSFFKPIILGKVVRRWPCLVQ